MSTVFTDGRLFPSNEGRAQSSAFAGIAHLMIGIVIKIILLMREGKRKETENESLKKAYMTAELELLKEQMNPHFLFNSLSSLSGVIREDPVLAQKYVR